MNQDAQHHTAATIRARALQKYGAWAPNAPHKYGLPPPDAPFAPLANVGRQLLHVNEGAVSEAPGQQIVADEPRAWLNNPATTQPGATARSNGPQRGWRRRHEWISKNRLGARNSRRNGPNEEDRSDPAN